MLLKLSSRAPQCQAALGVFSQRHAAFLTCGGQNLLNHKGEVGCVRLELLADHRKLSDEEAEEIDLVGFPSARVCGY